jgi:hypothetical protein
MRTRIGLALASDAVRAVAVRKQRIVWAAEAPLEAGASIRPVIEALLRLAPVRRFPRPVLSVAVGLHASQVKVLTGFPGVLDDATLTALIRENTGSFFLKNGVPLVTTRTRLMSTGVALGGAIEEPCVQTLRDICKALGWRLESIAPTPSVLVHVLTDASFAWADGPLLVEVTRSSDSIECVRTRLRSATEPLPAEPQPVPGLATLGEGAVRYADAYGAAVVESPAALGIESRATVAWSPIEARKRLLPPALLLAFGLASFLASPLGSVWAGDRARARLAAVRPDQKQVVVSTLARLDSVDAILEGSRRFAASRALVIPTFGGLVQGLPDGCILVSLELGDQQGSLTALCPTPAAVLAAVERLPGARAAEMVGAARRETVAGRQVQRVTVRWRRGAA